MKFSNLITIGLAGAGTIEAQRPMYRRDGPQIKTALQTIRPGFKALDKAISGFTDANVMDQIKVLKGAAKELNDLAVKAAAPLQQSTPLSLMGILGLVSPLSTFAKDLNETITIAMEKWPIIQKANLTSSVVGMVKDGRPGIQAMTMGIFSQIPDSLKTTMNGLTSGLGITIPSTPAEFDKIFDGMDQLLDSAMKGELTVPDLGALAGQLGGAKGTGSGTTPAAATSSTPAAKTTSSAAKPTSSKAEMTPTATTPAVMEPTPDAPVPKSPKTPKTGKGSRGKGGRGKGFGGKGKGFFSQVVEEIEVA